MSKTAHAGLISLISSVFGGEQVSAKTNPRPASNSQTIALLTAAVNPDPNPEKPSNIAPLDDGEILVPDLVDSGSSSGAPLSTDISTYVVRPGDTISGVAKMFNVSVNTVLWANNITGRSVLQPGQTLVILPISGITYTVKKGDTLRGIAKEFNADVGDISAFNDITSASALKSGDTLIIPNGEFSSVSTTKSGSVKSVPYEPLLDGSNSPAYPGYYSCPVPGARLTQGLHGHNAVDLAAPLGTPIRASAAGTVIIDRTSGWNGGYGSFIVIIHSNGTQTLYSHLSRSAVSLGEEVGKGETIGYIGVTGLTTGPHVHFEIRGAKNIFADPNNCR